MGWLPLIKSGVTASAWDPANMGSALSLSNTNLTVTQVSNDSTSYSVRSTNSHSTGKYYFEFRDKVTSGGAVLLGFGTAATPVGTTGTVIAFGDNNSIGWRGVGDVTYQSVSLAAIQSWDSNQTVDLQIAVDVGNQLFWFKNSTQGTGGWNNDLTADPAIGVNGIGVSPAMSGPLYIMCSLFRVTDEIDLNLGGSAYTYTPPAGFGNW